MEDYLDQELEYLEQALQYVKIKLSITDEEFEIAIKYSKNGKSERCAEFENGLLQYKKQVKNCNHGDY